MMKQFLFIYFLILFTSLSYGQEVILGMSTRFSDSFVEWALFSEKEDEEGNLEITWKMRNDFTEWNYDIGEHSGRIQQVWKNDPNQWEIRANDGTIITIQIRWRGDIREWRITDNTVTLNLKTKYGNMLDQWELKETTYGFYAIHTVYEGDPRDWEIIDELDDRVSFPMRMALAFIAMYHGTPKI